MTEQDLDRAFDNRDLAEFQRIADAHPVFLRKEDGEPENYFDTIAKQGLTEFAECLFAKGVGINERRHNVTLLYRAATVGNLRMCKWLVERGAEINAKDKDGVVWCLPLQTASWGGHLELTKYLVEQGADVNAIGPGMTPLDYALAYNKTEVVDYLRSVGAKQSFDLVPRDFPAAHKAILELVAEQFGPVSPQPLSGGQPNDVPIRVIPPNAKLKATTLFTLGLSDQTIRMANVRDGFLELVLHLPPKWPLDDSAQAWPIQALRQLARTAPDPGSPLTQSPILVPHGDPPEPLAPGTTLAGWWCWWDVDAPANPLNVSDRRAIYLLTMSPLHPEELAACRKEGMEDFAKRWKKKKAGVILDPKRKSIAGRR